MKNKMYKYKNWLYQSYVKEYLTCKEIANLCGVWPSTIHKNLVKFGIKTRNCSEMQLDIKNHRFGKKESDCQNWTGGKHSHYNELARKAWVEWWEQWIPMGYMIHHVDRNFKNNEISNLALVTAGYHKTIHKKGKPRNAGLRSHAIELAR